ncbi:MAG: hypothetical protein WB987_13060 [Candidatus Acidiferrales bacterium]
MKKNALFASLLLCSAIWLGGCSLLHVAGPPCVGNACPTGAGGQLPGSANANNQATAENKAQAKNADGSSQHRSLASRLHLTHGN